MDSHSIRDDHSPLPSQVPRTPVFPFPAEYPSLNFTAEAVNLDPPPLYSAFKDAFVRNYSLPYPTHDATPSGIVAENVEAAESRSAILEKLVTNWWLWEILSWVLSASCMCAIALVLGLYNNRSLPSRWPMGISLNALISILSAIAKYGLTVPLQEAIGQLKWAWFRKGEPRKLIDLDRFDEASRGPWGSLALILRMRGRSLASLVATVLILSLTLDPSLQQIAAYPKRPGLLMESSLTRSVNFKTVDNRVHDGAALLTLSDFFMAPTLANAFLSEGRPIEMSSPCPSTNCDWPPFETLGVCSTCKDMSDQLTFGCLTESGSWMSSRNYTITPPSHPNPPPRVTSCGYFLNATESDPFLMSGYTLNSSSSQPEPGEALWMRTFSLFTPELNNTYWNGTFHFKDIAETLPLMNFMISMNSDVASVYANKTPQAAECVLRWCTKKMSASVVNGTYTETVISTFTNDTAMPDPGVRRWDDQQSESIYHYTGNVTITPPGQNDTFSVSATTIWQTMDPLAQNIPSYFTSANVSATPQVRYLELPGTWDTYEKPIDLDTIPKNISAYVDRVTTAMTYVMRNYPNSSEPVDGSVGLETYIHIQWEWFSVPLFILFATLLVLVVTIAKGPARGEGGVWKTSSLALLMNGLDERTRQDIGDSWSLGDMKAKARLISVTLTPGLDGYRFQRIGAELGKI